MERFVLHGGNGKVCVRERERESNIFVFLCVCVCKREKRESEQDFCVCNACVSWGMRFVLKQRSNVR
jgi:hypothetical protein